MKRAVALVLLLAAEPASADRREASLHAHVVGGMAIASDAAVDDRATAPMGGIALRASYATSNTYQYDVSLSLLATGAAAFPEATFAPPQRPAVTGPYTITSQMTRIDAGVTFRLGVAWIPTVRLAVGGQGRRRGGPVVMDEGSEVTGEARLGRGTELGFDVVGAATAGVDHRINRRLIVGVAAGACVAVPLGGEPLHTLELTAHAAYYWYP